MQKDFAASSFAPFFSPCTPLTTLNALYFRFLSGLLLAAPAGPATQRLRNDNPSTNQEATVQADYQTPLGPKQLLEIGGKDIVRRVRSDYAHLTVPGPDGTYQPLPGGSLANTFSYRQNVAATYASITTSLGAQYSLKAGALRAHHHRGRF